MVTTSSATNNLFEKMEALFSKELKHILKREQLNENRINLYSVGEYWAAFDRSAYLLELYMNEEEEPSVLELKEYPFPVMMHNIHYTQVEKLCYKFRIAKRDLEYLQLVVHPINDKAYNDWYRNYVMENCLMEE